MSMETLSVAIIAFLLGYLVGKSTNAVLGYWGDAHKV